MVQEHGLLWAMIPEKGAKIQDIQGPQATLSGRSRPPHHGVLNSTCA